ncbi:hypothetical protein JRQ81_014348 [Phrynocephalus forsythii]|uniref:Uncharacterized protein n=1 Tax=Phrynocephalus forsythii TaxID=171643 RepID=A0A9Q0XZ57_9SAUR|nr:hypothetical protein JRQ81_014348 [Phrynocephalus forsythii]
MSPSTSIISVPHMPPQPHHSSLTVETEAETPPTLHHQAPRARSLPSKKVRLQEDRRDRNRPGRSLSHSPSPLLSCQVNDHRDHLRSPPARNRSYDAAEPGRPLRNRRTPTLSPTPPRRRNGGTLTDVEDIQHRHCPRDDLTQRHATERHRPFRHDPTDRDVAAQRSAAHAGELSLHPHRDAWRLPHSPSPMSRRPSPFLQSSHRDDVIRKDASNRARKDDTAGRNDTIRSPPIRRTRSRSHHRSASPRRRKRQLTSSTSSSSSTPPPRRKHESKATRRARKHHRTRWSDSTTSTSDTDVDRHGRSRHSRASPSPGRPSSSKKARDQTRNPSKDFPTLPRSKHRTRSSTPESLASMECHQDSDFSESAAAD